MTSSPYSTITLKPHKETSALYHHPWIFSGAIDYVDPHLHHGDLVSVTDHTGKFIGIGTYSASSSIAVRLLAFTTANIDQTWFQQQLKSADDTRHLLGYGPDTTTTGYRVVFSEADHIPGLILDRYADTIVFQISTAGLDRLRPQIIAAIQTVFSPDTIIERSDLAVRHQEQLEDVVACHYGNIPSVVEFTEHGIAYLADVYRGQKTGFFLDQKDLRQALSSLAAEKTILNLFSYTGSNAVVALTHGATHVTNIDSSQPALDIASHNLDLNHLDSNQYDLITADVFDWLSAPPAQTYDLIILDPPALIKSRSDIAKGKKAYHFLNTAAMALLNPRGMLITSSCSHFLSASDLMFILRQASVQSGINLKLTDTIYQSPDHPQSLYFDHSLYLKSLICQKSLSR